MYKRCVECSVKIFTQFFIFANDNVQALDTAIRDLMNDVSRQIQDKNIAIPPLTSTKLELQAQTE